MPKVKWTKKCKCGNFIPDEYELCDYCLLKKYNLYETSPWGYEGLFSRKDVITALREAERGNKNE